MVRRVQEIERLVQEKEADMEPINEDLCNVGTDYEKAQELGDALKSLEDDIEALYDEWAELEEALGKVE